MQGRRCRLVKNSLHGLGVSSVLKACGKAQRPCLLYMPCWHTTLHHPPTPSSSSTHGHTCTPLFMPKPPAGGKRCAASPASSTAPSPASKRAATCGAVQGGSTRVRPISSAGCGVLCLQVFATWGVWCAITRSRSWLHRAQQQRRARSVSTTHERRMWAATHTATRGKALRQKAPLSKDAIAQASMTSLSDMAPAYPTAHLFTLHRVAP